MFSTFLLALTFTAAIWFWLKSPRRETASERSRDRIAAMVLAGVFVICLLTSMLVFIPSQNIGVIRVFGVVNPARGFGEGVHMKAPWEKVQKISYEFEDMDMTGETDRFEQVSFISEDGVQITTGFVVRWRVNPAHLLKVKAKMPSDGVYTAAVYRIARDAARDPFATRRVDDGSVFNRDAVRDAMQAALEAESRAYFTSMGLPADSVEYGRLTLRNIMPDDTVYAAMSNRSAGLINRQVNPVPEGLTPAEYAKIVEAQAIAKAAANGSQITIVSGAAAAVVGRK